MDVKGIVECRQREGVLEEGLIQGRGRPRQHSRVEGHQRSGDVDWDVRGRQVQVLWRTVVGWLPGGMGGNAAEAEQCQAGCSGQACHLLMEHLQARPASKPNPQVALMYAAPENNAFCCRS